MLLQSIRASARMALICRRRIWNRSAKTRTGCLGSKDAEDWYAFDDIVDDLAQFTRQIHVVLAPTFSERI